MKSMNLRIDLEPRNQKKNKHLKKRKRAKKLDKDKGQMNLCKILCHKYCDYLVQFNGFKKENKREI